MSAAAVVVPMPLLGSEVRLSWPKDEHGYRQGFRVVRVSANGDVDVKVRWEDCVEPAECEPWLGADVGSEWTLTAGQVASGAVRWVAS